jgi:hypothetical protein
MGQPEEEETSQAGNPSTQLDGPILRIEACDAQGKTVKPVSTLHDGGTYTDSVNNLSISQVAAEQDRLTVTINISGSCETRPPHLSIQPATQTANGGTTLRFALNMTNADSISCPATAFILIPGIPQGWAGDMNPTSLSLAPGESGTATLSITAPFDASNGSYPVGVSLSDPTNPAHLAQAGGSFVVNDCSRAPPQLSFAPPSQSEMPGGVLTYVLSVTNKDSRSCGASTFELSSSIPTGWRGSLNKNSLTLSPGAQGSVTLKVSSPMNAAGKSYALQLSSSDTANPAHHTSSKASYTVLGIGDIQPPSPPQALVTKIQGKQISLSWQASHDNVGVEGYTIWRDYVKIADTKETNFVDKNVNSGTTYHYSITAFDAAGNISVRSNQVTIKKR